MKHWILFDWNVALFISMIKQWISVNNVFCASSVSDFDDASRTFGSKGDGNLISINLVQLLEFEIKYLNELCLFAVL